jgi:hypothetical protein
MAAPAQLHDLVERFDRNIEAYRSGDYNETQVRREFIDPLFKLLGWDIDNEQGYAEAYKDVIHEYSLKIGGNTKAPGYCFRVGGTPSFSSKPRNPPYTSGRMSAQPINYDAMLGRPSCRSLSSPISRSSRSTIAESSRTNTTRRRRPR